jgi:hypothetical protein
MSPLALIFPASVLPAVGVGFFCFMRYGRASFAFRLCLFFLGYLLLSYVAGFISFSLHPYWIDNEVEEFVPWAGRWSWAVFDAAFFEIVLCPLLLLGFFLLRSRHLRAWAGR